MPSLIDANTNQVLFNRLVIADRFWSRAIGLMGKLELANDQAIWIRPCKSIHTFFMRISINVAFVGKDGTVLAVHYNVRPWRFLLGVRGVVDVIEYSTQVDVLHKNMRVAIKDG